MTLGGLPQHTAAPWSHLSLESAPTYQEPHVLEGQSRGCLNCSRRNLKCDNTGGGCVTCHLGGYQCPGYDRLATIVRWRDDAVSSIDSGYHSVYSHENEQSSLRDGETKTQKRSRSRSSIFAPGPTTRQTNGRFVTGPRHDSAFFKMHCDIMASPQRPSWDADLFPQHSPGFQGPRNREVKKQLTGCQTYGTNVASPFDFSALLDLSEVDDHPASRILIVPVERCSNDTMQPHERRALAFPEENLKLGPNLPFRELSTNGLTNEGNTPRRGGDSASRNDSGLAGYAVSGDVDLWLQNVNAVPGSLRPLTTVDHASISSLIASPTAITCSTESRAQPDVEDSGSPWFASEGEASFALGGDPLPTRKEDEPLEISEISMILAQHMVALFLAKDNDRAEDAGDDSQTGSPSTGSSSQMGARAPTSTTTVPGQSGGPSSKRARPDGSDGDGEDEDGAKRVRRSNLTKEPSAGPEGKLLACPYSKYDPRRYSERNSAEKNYRGCSSCLLRDITRLKQHLYRVHRRPEHYCMICFSVFDSYTALEAHAQERSCQSVPSPFEERMTPDTLTEIKRKEPGRSPATAWFNIYKKLFPGAPLPLDPYVEDMLQSETVQNYMAFFEREAPGLLASEINTRMFGYASTVPGQDEFVESLLADSIRVLLETIKAGYRSGR